MCLCSYSGEASRKCGVGWTAARGVFLAAFVLVVSTINVFAR